MRKSRFSFSNNQAKFFLDPKKMAEMQEYVQRKLAKTCFGCKQAICFSRVYCGKLKRYVDTLVYCPHFQPEPIEYTLYRRA